MKKRVAIAGGTGRTGREIVRYLASTENIQVVGVLSRTHGGKSMTSILPDFPYDIPVFDNVEEMLEKTRPQVCVDFTPSEVAVENFRQCVKRRIHPIIASTGFSSEEIQVIARSCATDQLGGALIPNFSLASMVILEAAKIMAEVFDDVSIVEMHPHTKRDIPSGTAVKYVRDLSEMPKFQGKSIPTHSIRITGAVSQHDLIFGGQGELINLSHQVIDRSCFGPGVAVAILAIEKYTYLVTNLREFFSV